MVDALPDEHGVYWFLDRQAKPCYINAGIKLQQRVRSHFSGTTASRKRQPCCATCTASKHELSGSEWMAAVMEDVYPCALAALEPRSSNPSRAEQWCTMSIGKAAVAWPSAHKQVPGIRFEHSIQKPRAPGCMHKRETTNSTPNGWAWSMD